MNGDRRVHLLKIDRKTYIGANHKAGRGVPDYQVRT